MKEIEKVEEIKTEDEERIKDTEKKEEVKETAKKTKKTVKKENEEKAVESKTESEEKKSKVKLEDTNKEVLQEETINSNIATVLEEPQKAFEEKIEEDNNVINEKLSNGLHRYTKIIVVVSILLLISAMLFSTIFALMNKSSNKIVDGISIRGIDLSGLTQEEANSQLNEIFSAQLKKDITLKHGDFETTIIPEQIEMNFKIEEAVNLAYSVGRTGKILKDNYSIINAKLAKLEVNPAYFYNEEALTNFITSTQGNLPDLVKQSSYSVDGANLVIDKGSKGVLIEQEELKKQIINQCITLRTRKFNYRNFNNRKQARCY